MRYRDAGGREQTLTFGLYPLVDLDGARARRDHARAQLDRGEDPRALREEAVRTFEHVARAWIAHRAGGWSRVHAADVEASLARDVFPAIGARPLAAIDSARVLKLLRAIEARGSIETARRVRQRIERIFAFAAGEDWFAGPNPALVAENLANAPGAGRQPALVDLDELRALMTAVEETPASALLRLASRVLALTAVRLAALRGMRWREIDGLDGPAPLWTVPPERLKLEAANKHDAARAHLVPLSVPATAALRAARLLAGDEVEPDDLVFPIGTGALGELYDRAGFAGRHVPHGWRASFSTVMNECRPDDRLAIDRALGHLPKNMTKVEKAYNRAQYLPLRRELLEEWGALIAPN